MLETVGVKPSWRPSRGPNTAAAAAAAATATPATAAASPPPQRQVQSGRWEVWPGNARGLSDVWITFVAQRRHPAPALPKVKKNFFYFFISTDFERKKTNKTMEYTHMLGFDLIQDHRTTRLSLPAESHVGLCAEKEI